MIRRRCSYHPQASYIFWICSNQPKKKTLHWITKERTTWQNSFSGWSEDGRGVYILTTLTSANDDMIKWSFWPSANGDIIKWSFCKWWYDQIVILQIHQMVLLLQAVPALPVMVFLHGGGYVSGSGSRLLYGPELFMDRQVITMKILILMLWWTF